MDFFRQIQKDYNNARVIIDFIILLTFIVVVVYMTTLILLIIYYMTAGFVQYTNNTHECNKCISNKDSCNTILRYMFIISIVYIIASFLLNSYIENNLGSSSVIMQLILYFIINIVMFVVTTNYITCLYNNFTNMNEINCPCMTNYKTKVNILKYLSVLLYTFMIIILALVLFWAVGLILQIQ
jgi:hypothetical protein